MSEPVSLLGLLADWESAKRDGRYLSPETLCRDHPEFLEPLQQRILALQAVDNLFGTPNHRSQSNDSTLGEHIASASTNWQGSDVVAQTNLRVLGSHARGGLGEVFIARDEVLERQVALKVLQTPFDHDQDCRKRFLREAEITGQLEHPGIVPVHNLGEDREGRPCYTMRFVNGESMHAAIERYHRDKTTRSANENLQQLRQLVQRFISVCNTVAYAHNRGVLHRDLKPSNIMLGSFSETLVVDWGLAKVYVSPLANNPQAPNVSVPNGVEGLASNDSDPSTCESTDKIPDTLIDSSHQCDRSREAVITEMGGILGTPAFMSPEQARGENSLTPASDIYSLGATLYLLVVGKPAFTGESTPMILQRVRSGKFLNPRALDVTISRPLEAIILHAMQFDPKQRYATALSLAADLENWLVDEPVSVYQGTLVDRALRWSRRHRTQVIATFVASVFGLLSLLAIAVQTTRSNRLLVAANEREKQSSTFAKKQADLADNNARVADEQSRLALSILQTVIQNIQKDLAKLPRAQSMRRDLLNKSMEGLEAVAASVERRQQLDRNQLLAHRDLADIFLLIGNDGENAGFKNAKRHLDSALSTARRLVAAAPEDRQARMDLATVCERMSHVLWLSSATEESKDYIEELLQLRQTLAHEMPQELEAQTLLANAHNHAGDLYIKERSLKQAAEHFTFALELTRKLSQQHPEDDQVLKQYHISLNNCGDVHRRQREWDAAMQDFEESLVIARQRVQANTQDDSVKGDLAYTLNAMGKMLYNQGKLQQIETLYRESLEINQQRFSQDPTNAALQRDLITQLQNLGDLMIKLNQLDRASQYFDMMLELALERSSLDPENRTAQHDLSIAYQRVGGAHHSRNEIDDALLNYEKSLQISRDLAAREPDNVREQSGLAIDLSNLGLILLDQENFDQAITHLEESVSIYRHIVECMPDDATFRRQYSVVLSQWGAALRRAGQFDRARVANDESLALVQRMLKTDSKSPALRLDYVLVLNARGYLERSAEDLKAAREWFQKALEIIGELEQEKQLFGSDQEWRSDLEAAIASCSPAT